MLKKVKLFATDLEVFDDVTDWDAPEGVVHEVELDEELINEYNSAMKRLLSLNLEMMKRVYRR